jgi:hypothetical protein
VTQALLVNSMTVGQHVRRVMETHGDFESAVTALARGPIINEAYLTVGGLTPNQGAVITMGRERAVDILRPVTHHVLSGVLSHVDSCCGMNQMFVLLVLAASGDVGACCYCWCWC